MQTRASTGNYARADASRSISMPVALEPWFGKAHEDLKRQRQRANDILIITYHQLGRRNSDSFATRARDRFEHSARRSGTEAALDHGQISGLDALAQPRAKSALFSLS